MANEAPPQTDEVYGASGVRYKAPAELAGQRPGFKSCVRSVGPKTRGRPEPAMSTARSAAEVLAEHVVLEVEAIDRMYLNVYIPQLQSVGGSWAICTFTKVNALRPPPPSRR